MLCVFYFLLLFVCVYVALYLKEKKTKMGQMNSYVKKGLTSSRVIVDSIGGDNQASPIKAYLDYVSDSNIHTLYSLKGDFNE